MQDLGRGGEHRAHLVGVGEHHERRRREEPQREALAVAGAAALQQRHRPRPPAERLQRRRHAWSRRQSGSARSSQRKIVERSGAVRAVRHIGMRRSAGLTIPGVSSRRPNVILFLVDDMGWMDSAPTAASTTRRPTSTGSPQCGMLVHRRLCAVAALLADAGEHADRQVPGAARDHERPTGTCPRCPTSCNVLSGDGAAGPAHDHAGEPTVTWTPRSTRWPRRCATPATGPATSASGTSGAAAAALARAAGVRRRVPRRPDPGPPRRTATSRPTASAQGTITPGPEGEYIIDRLPTRRHASSRTNRDRPFFLNLWHTACTGRGTTRRSYTREFAERTDPRGEQGNPIMASMLSSVDESLGRMLDEARRAGLAENTIVVFNSDNGGNVHSNTPGDWNARMAAATSAGARTGCAGPASRPPTSNAPLRDGKGTLYEGGVRVPLIVAWPGRVEPGSRSATRWSRRWTSTRRCSTCSAAPARRACASTASASPPCCVTARRSRAGLPSSTSCRNDKAALRPGGSVRRGRLEADAQVRRGARRARIPRAVRPPARPGRDDRPARRTSPSSCASWTH